MYVYPYVFMFMCKYLYVCACMHAYIYTVMIYMYIYMRLGMVLMRQFLADHWLALSKSGMSESDASGRASAGGE